jgi:hypothetical protein
MLIEHLKIFIDNLYFFFWEFSFSSPAHLFSGLLILCRVSELPIYSGYSSLPRCVTGKDFLPLCSLSLQSSDCSLAVQKPFNFIQSHLPIFFLNCCQKCQGEITLHYQCTHLKNEGQESKIGFLWRWVSVGEDIRKGWRRANMVDVIFIHVWK